VDRLIAALREAERKSAHDTLMMLLAAVQDFANGHPLCDDLSLTVIQRVAKNGIGRSPQSPNGKSASVQRTAVNLRSIVHNRANALSDVSDNS
jgi:hypothetical protein